MIVAFHHIFSNSNMRIVLKSKREFVDNILIKQKVSCIYKTCTNKFDNLKKLPNWTCCKLLGLYVFLPGLNVIYIS